MQSPYPSILAVIKFERKLVLILKQHYFFLLLLLFYGPFGHAIFYLAYK